MDGLEELHQHEHEQAVPDTSNADKDADGEVIGSPSQAGIGAQPPVAGPSVLPVPEGPPEGPLAVPQKRRPGRPRGSGKKYAETNPDLPKIRRPVGRPRKDGLPAGSLGPPKKTRTHVFPLSVTPASLKKILNSIDPSLQQDDWPVLAQTQPNAFLRALITTMNMTPGIGAQKTAAEEDAYRSHLFSLSAKATQSEHIPSLYSVLKTFWLPASPAYFSLIASASTGRTPSEHRFLYWDPLPLVFNGLLCPCCCQAHLINRSRLQSGPLKVYDVPKPFFIIGCEYVCKGPQCVAQTSSEGRSFASTDVAILRALPAMLREEFPARLLQDEGLSGTSPKIWNWQALGVSQTVWNMTVGAMRAGLNKDAILQMLNATLHGVSEPAEAQSLLPPPPMPMQRMGSPFEMKSAPLAMSGVPPTDGGASADEVEQEVAQPTMEEDEAGVEGGDEERPSLEYPTNFVPMGTAPPDVHQSASAPPSGSVTQTTGPPGSIPADPLLPPPPAQPQQPYTPFYSGYAYYGVHPAQAYPGAPPGAYPPPPPPPGLPPVAGVKRGSPDDGFTSTKRSPRHCLKCGSQECKGKGGRHHCQNPCQDCGTMECQGRNGRRRDKPCREGWD
ncbi:hypothetical protein BD626DRAFT_240745 [Schizophyllum amplum]|uniref:Uncharacterized protein n=1 Tax=Schizophyllum amplum TaxID=97359 RepID=A0A550CJZ4_9AGAR|nr:hypothetical protein BD626DRAFT_240745 [Auriculariopsis ampla]